MAIDWGAGDQAVHDIMSQKRRRRRRKEGWKKERMKGWKKEGRRWRDERRESEGRKEVYTIYNNYL